LVYGWVKVKRGYFGLPDKIDSLQSGHSRNCESISLYHFCNLLKMSTMDKYEKLEKVREGAYRKVYKARDKISG